MGAFPNAKVTSVSSAEMVSSAAGDDPWSGSCAEALGTPSRDIHTRRNMNTATVIPRNRAVKVKMGCPRRSGIQLQSAGLPTVRKLLNTRECARAGRQELANPTPSHWFDCRTETRTAIKCQPRVRAGRAKGRWCCPQCGSRSGGDTRSIPLSFPSKR